MSFTDWVGKTREDIDDEGLNGFRYGVHQLYWGFLRRLDLLFQNGTNIYDQEWNLLIILDGCRTDAIAEVASDYDFLSNAGVQRSVGSASVEWLEKTFTEEVIYEMSETVHVTANGHTNMLNPNSFLHLEKVHEWGWDNNNETTPAENVTQAAIKHGREYREERKRMIVHYMQPHFPSVPEPIGHGTKTQKAWDRLWSDNLDEETLWSSYIANLRYVLDSVEILLNNIDAERVIISADHGNAKGEWGVYDHPHGLPLSCLRDVPWYKTTATDSGEYHPDLDGLESETSSVAVSEQLEALGYT